MARHQNSAVKRARELNKKRKTEDKRAKRQQKKTTSAQDAAVLPRSEDLNGAAPDGSSTHGQASHGPAVQGAPGGERPAPLGLPTSPPS